MNRKSSAEWIGTIRTGYGQITTESGALKQLPNSFDTRFGDRKGTNPEELVGASLAACYSMALAAQLKIEHFEPESVKTEVEVQLRQIDGTWGISEIHLVTEVRTSEISQDRLIALAEETKKTCPIGKLLNAHITVSAKLQPSTRSGVVDAAH